MAEHPELYSMDGFYKAHVSPCILTYRGLHCGLLHPLDGLPGVDDPDVLPLDHLVQELAEGLAVLLVLEPSCDQIDVTKYDQCDQMFLICYQEVWK